MFETWTLFFCFRVRITQELLSGFGMKGKDFTPGLFGEGETGRKTTVFAATPTPVPNHLFWHHIFLSYVLREKFELTVCVHSTQMTLVPVRIGSSEGGLDASDWLLSRPSPLDSTEVHSRDTEQYYAIHSPFCYPFPGDAYRSESEHSNQSTTSAPNSRIFAYLSSLPLCPAFISI